MNFFKKVFRFKTKKHKSITLPKEWNKTSSDLFNELKNGERKEITAQEINWAAEYERQQIPIKYRFPKKGDLYESKIDQEVDYLTHWLAPYTGGGTTKLHKGEKIWIEFDYKKHRQYRPISAYALPVNYYEIEKRVVPSSERNAGKYDGFCFSISTNSLNEDFILIEENFSKEKYT